VRGENQDVIAMRLTQRIHRMIHRNEATTSTDR
jgi:hypothetical protein